MATHIMGIRHHGPGSARNVRARLEELKPDIILVEGPPEADSLLEWVGNEQLQPPIAILAYEPDAPHHSAFYPFAAYSPEWQAISYAREHRIPVRFMDLPLIHVFALDKEKQQAAAETDQTTAETDPTLNNAAAVPEEAPETFDPIALLATADGYTDGEAWWDHMFEYRQQNEQVFEAIMEAMQTLRQELAAHKDERNELREAWMRKMIRQAEKEMYPEIAVICGAWHAPALQDMPAAKVDNELLKGLPKVKVACSWTPWTFHRLSFQSGYRAGIKSPGWYQHKWEHPTDDGTRWLTNVARLFREKQMDISTAHVLEAVRLSNALAAMRQLPAPALDELNEATIAILCNGDTIPMQLIEKELIISNRIGSVPEDVPKAPLQADIEKQQKKLRLQATADFKDYQLDLRQPNDLQRSIFLHRLHLLDINWGEQHRADGKGTFREQWRLQWAPELAVDIIDKSCWGNTVATAAASYVTDMATRSNTIREVCRLLEDTIPAELPEATDMLINRVNNMAAASSDVLQLIEVLPPLVAITRYGNVRKTDAGMVLAILESMITRICIQLPPACTGVAEDAASVMLDQLYNMNDAIQTLQQEEITASWQHALHIICRNTHAARSLAGYATRLLSDARVLGNEELVTTFSVAMSVGNNPADAAAWLEGFLRGSGSLLLVDNTLLHLLQNWVNDLGDDIFIQLLPLLRRTFAAFSSPERRQIGEKIKKGDNVSTSNKALAGTEDTRGQLGIPVIMQLLGYGQTVNQVIHE